MGIGLNGGMVTGTRAAKGAIDYIANVDDFELDENMVQNIKDIVTAPAKRNMGHSPAWLTQVLQHTIVPYYVLIYKHGKRLETALSTVEYLENELEPNLMAEDPHDWRLAYETKNMLLNAEMTLRSSLFRTESRASHFREDYPERNDEEWLAWTKLREENGKMILYKEPIPERFKPDYSKSAEEIYPLSLPSVSKDKFAEDEGR